MAALPLLPDLSPEGITPDLVALRRAVATWPITDVSEMEDEGDAIDHAIEYLTIAGSGRAASPA